MEHRLSRLPAVSQNNFDSLPILAKGHHLSQARSAPSCSYQLDLDTSANIRCNLIATRLCYRSPSITTLQTALGAIPITVPSSATNRTFAYQSHLVAAFLFLPHDHTVVSVAPPKFHLQIDSGVICYCVECIIVDTLIYGLWPSEIVPLAVEWRFMRNLSTRPSGPTSILSNSVPELLPLPGCPTPLGIPHKTRHKVNLICSLLS